MIITIMMIIVIIMIMMVITTMILVMTIITTIAITIMILHHQTLHQTHNAGQHVPEVVCGHLVDPNTVIVIGTIVLAIYTCRLVLIPLLKTIATINGVEMVLTVTIMIMITMIAILPTTTITTQIITIMMAQTQMLVVMMFVVKTVIAVDVYGLFLMGIHTAIRTGLKMSVNYTRLKDILGVVIDIDVLICILFFLLLK